MSDDKIAQLLARAHQHQLSPNATPLEQALAEIDQRILELPANIIRQSKAPNECPAHLLPHLAWERSVDVWDPDWPEDVKRRVIGASYIVHRYKGTCFAVDAALEALGFRASITEWWQATPQAAPYTFHVRGLAVERVLSGAPLINEQMTRAAYAAVLATKPVSRGFTFDVGAGFGATATFGAAARALQVVQPQAIARPPTRPGGTLNLTARGRALQVRQVISNTAPLRRPAGNLLMAGRMRGLQIVRAQMETIAA